VVRSQGRKRAFCGGSEEKSRLFFGRDFCLETQARRAFAVANEAERRVPRGADRLLSRWPEEHAGQKEIDLVCRVPGKTWQCIHLFRAEIRASMLERSIFDDHRFRPVSDSRQAAYS
jgi:hypothetical protein